MGNLGNRLNENEANGNVPATPDKRHVKYGHTSRVGSIQQVTLPRKDFWTE